MKSMKLMAALVAVATSAFANAARAANPIEFTFGGVFTQTTGTVHQVGQSFTSVLLFDPAAPDLNPSPLLGRYAFLSWTTPGPFAAPYVLANDEIDLFRDSGTDSWRAQFVGGIPFAYTLQVDFPPGHFPSDALPVTLDLSQSTGAFYIGFEPGSNVNLRGTINSLSVRGIPEPVSAVGIALLSMIINRTLRRAQR